MDGLMSLLTSSGGRTDLPTPVRSQPDVQGMGQTEVESGREDEETSASEEESLHAFRTQRLQFLPLIHIPATITVGDLKRQSPFLWRCISAVESKHTARQATLCVKIRELAGKRLLVDCDKSLDLLQGVLVYLAWYGVLNSHCGSVTWGLLKFSPFLTYSRPGSRCTASRISHRSVYIPKWRWG